jgi:signal transduction histidine kinase
VTMASGASADTVTERVVLEVDIRLEHDAVFVRQRARQLAGLLGFDSQEQTRIATAVSELARNAFQYAGGGRAELIVVAAAEPLYLIRITDHGPGIRDLQAVLDGQYISPTGMGIGLAGARRLTDIFEIQSDPALGTRVTLGKRLPRRSLPLTPARLTDLGRALRSIDSRDPFAELQAQNHELLRTLDALQARQAEVEHLNAELAETNRGVLALYAELDDRAVDLARASDLKSQFLSNISHELRTPLNSILNVTRLLLDRMDGDLTSEQDRQVTLVRDAASSLLEIVNDLLDLARIEAGKTVLRLGHFSADEVLGALRSMLRPLVMSGRVALVVEPAPDIGPLYGDEGKVSQILRNLVANAVRFTERGEVRMRAEPQGLDRIRFVVSDTGIGIAPEFHDRIFEEYGQLDSPLQRRSKGSGLGLPLSRKLAQLLGGTLTVRSDLGQGSEFTLEIPLTVPEAPEVPHA